MAIFRNMVSFVKGLFWKQKMDVTLVGIQCAGKTTLLSAITDGKLKAERDTIPTIGLNTRTVTKGNVSMKLWDIGGSARFRNMWERYCRSVDAIVYVIDAQDRGNFGASKACLHELMSKASLAGIPLLVLANKNDTPDALNEKEVEQEFELFKIKDRVVTCYSISAKSYVNIDITMKWLIENAKKKAAAK